MSAIGPGSDLYIDVPIDTDPQDLLTDCYNYLAANIPGWAPAQGNLDVWLLMAIASICAETRDVASLVPASIFRWFGANLINVPPIDDAPAVLTSTWTMVDTNGYTIPAGTQVAIPIAGASPIPFITTADTVIAPGSSVATNVQLQAVNPGADANTIGSIAGPITLLDALTFVSTVVQSSLPTGGVDAELDEDYLNRLASELQLLAPRPILARDFAIYSRNVTNVYRVAAYDGYNPLHNLMTLNDASLETSIGNWIANTNCTVTWDATWGADGTHSLKMTSVAAGNMDAVKNSTGQSPVTPGEVYTAVATVKPASTRSCYVGIAWYTSGGAWLSTSTGSAPSCPAGVATQLSATGPAPATAAFARVDLVVIGAAAAGEVANWDKMSFRHGSTTDWVPGGTAETGQPRMVTVAATDINGNPIDSATKTALQNYLQSVRETTFLVYVIDPTVDIIDVTCAVKAQPNWDTTLVRANVIDAISTFLNTQDWGTYPGTHNPQDWNNVTVLRYNALLAIIGEAAGVAYVETLTFGPHGGALAAADLTLTGVFPLPTVAGGTVNVTVDP